MRIFCKIRYFMAKRNILLTLRNGNVLISLILISFGHKVSKNANEVAFDLPFQDGVQHILQKWRKGPIFAVQGFACEELLFYFLLG